MRAAESSAVDMLAVDKIVEGVTAILHSSKLSSTSLEIFADPSKINVTTHPNGNFRSEIDRIKKSANTNSIKIQYEH